MCAISRKLFNKNFIEAPIIFTTTAFEQERCLAILQKKGSCVNYGDICFLNLYHDRNRIYMNVMQPREIWHIDFFHAGYLVAQNDVVVRIADIDNTFIIILINIENLQQV